MSKSMMLLASQNGQIQFLSTDKLAVKQMVNQTGDGTH